MRNYLATLGLNRNSNLDEYQNRIDALTDEELELEGDIKQIMLDNSRRQHYERVHLQYEAIAAATAQWEDSELTVDSHQWHRRLVEFELPADQLDDL